MPKREVGAGKPEAAKFIADSGCPRPPRGGRGAGQDPRPACAAPPREGRRRGGVTSVAKSQRRRAQN